MSFEGMSGLKSLESREATYPLEGFSWRYVELREGLNNAAWRRWCSRVLKTRRRVFWLRSAAWVLYVVTCFYVNGVCVVFMFCRPPLFAVCGRLASLPRLFL